MNQPSENPRGVLVTGGSKGIGRAIALAFCAEGDAVTITGRDGAALEETAQQAAELPGTLRPFAIDGRDEPGMTRLIAEMPTLDIAVNNAGIAWFKPLLETSTDEMRQMMEVNVNAAFVVMRESARRMALTGGLIVNIASNLALKGMGQGAPYAASKHALLGLARSVQKEFARAHIRVTTLCPGPVDTAILGPASQNPASIAPDDIAKLVVCLASLAPTVAVPEIHLSPTRDL